MKTIQVKNLKKSKRAINLLAGLSVFALVFNTTCALAQSNNWDDDVYSTPKDRVIKKPDVPLNTKEGTRYNADTIDNYKNQPNYTQSDNNGATVINNYYDDDFNYDDYYDYGYAARLRRFYRPCYGYNYYDGYYTNSYWYDYNPYHFGTSIYLGYNWWGPTNYYYRYYPSYNWSYGYGYSGWGGGGYYGYSNYNPYYGGYNGWGGYYGNGYGYRNGYINGYNHGYNQGYYNGTYGNGYSNNDNYYYNSRDNNSHYYGHRNSPQSNGSNPGPQRTGTRSGAQGFAQKYEEAVATENVRNQPRIENHSPANINAPHGINNSNLNMSDPNISNNKKENGRVAPDRAPVLNNGTLNGTKTERASNPNLHNYNGTPGNNVEKVNNGAGTVAPGNERNSRLNTGATQEQYNNGRETPPIMQSPNGGNLDYNNSRIGNDNNREQFNHAPPVKPNSGKINNEAPSNNNYERGGKNNQINRESVPTQNQTAPRQANPPVVKPAPRSSGNNTGGGNYQAAPKSNGGSLNRGGGGSMQQAAPRSSGGGTINSGGSRSGSKGSSGGGNVTRPKR